MFSTHKDIEVFLLEFLSNFYSCLIVRCSTKDSSKTGGSAINKFNPSFPEDDIIGSPQPDIIIGRVFLFGIEIRLFQIPYRLNNLLSEEGSHAGIKSWRQIG
ncbi:hypothetical protein ES708_27790 [subsurface metagenome]